ncbi:MAG: ORF6N domain-containing protein [Deltaproteobacteria bacterium]|nr:ORF6N domain-containing protein [Deltaproteobacteria bacterium]
MKSLIPIERIENSIYLIRDQKVILDEHLAALYNVETKVFNRAVKRNIKRFPDDFMFQLCKREYDHLRLRAGVIQKGRGRHRKYLPYVFTEQGVAMLSSVLNSDRAIQVNIEIMRAFVKLRELMSTHKDIVRKIYSMEKKYDTQIQSLFQAINKLMEPPTKKQRLIGFVRDK